MNLMDMNHHKNRVKWFLHDRFGMFIHWGLYAIPGRGEWVRSTEKISVEEYQQYFDSFNPVDFDPKTWAKMAKEAGMKYAVMTAKHHDGFCLFDSELTEYKCTNTKFGKDLVREYIEAFRAEGLKVGLYYSLIDWHHPHYPHYGDMTHPMRDNEKYKDVVHDFEKYLDYLHGQVLELCENYGQIDVLWFDFSYDEMRGEKWRATELVKKVRALQPDVIIDNRLEVSGEGFGSIVTEEPLYYSGDFVSPEQIIPPNGIRNARGELVPWESCITMNNHWGYCKNDYEYKSATAIVRKLVECVSKGGNLLLNVGPDPRSNIPEESLKILSDVGKWMAKNKDSIYGCSIASLNKPDYGRITRSNKKIYLHITEDVIGPIPVKGIIKDDIKSICLLATGSEVNIANTCITSNYPDYMFLSYGENPHFTYGLPDSIDTVIEIELK